MAPIHCPICLSGADKGRSRDYGERQQYACRQCGTFEICASAIAVLKTRFDENPELRQRLSYQIRRAVDAGSHPLDRLRKSAPEHRGQVRTCPRRFRYLIRTVRTHLPNSPVRR